MPPVRQIKKENERVRFGPTSRFARNGKKECMLCGKSFAASTSTASFWYHIRKKHNKATSVRDTPFENEKADDLLRHFVVSNGLPLRIVESEQFREFAAYLRPGYKTPTRKKLTTALLPEMRDELEAAMKEKMSSIKYHSLSLDSWTAQANQGYIAVTSHGITKEWVLETFLLGVAPVTASETAVFIADIVEEMLETWKIAKENIVSATSDGGANVKCAVQKELDFLWVYCLAHVINRSVRLGLDSASVKGIIKKAKAISKLFKASPNAARSLRQKQEALKIPIKNLKIDNKTRWSSAYKMVKRMCQSRPAISACLATLTGTRRRIPHDLTTEEWELVEKLVAVLKPFKDASEFISQQRHPTIGVVMPIVNASHKSPPFV